MSELVERLRGLLDYDPETGDFKWKVDRGSKIKKGAMAGSIHMPKKGYSRYLIIETSGKKYKAHRIAFALMEGDFPEGIVDHIDGDGLNNKWENLRKGTTSQNSRNIRLPRTPNNMVIGVSWHTTIKKWQAYIVMNKKQKHLGLFNDFFEACCARKSAENKYNFHVW